MALSIHVQLQQFEGPLDLLLYLIRKEEMDIFDININQITKQYFEFIKLMKELDLEVAGEFIAMASTLIHIKSRLLLPQYNENGEVVENIDPRKELVQKLLEYQKYQEAARSLNERPLVGRDIWVRGVREVLKPADDEILLEDNALFALISTYRTMIRSIKKKVHQVTAKAQSISSRIMQMKDRLIVGQRVLMNDLIDAVEDKRKQILITFLSLLELGKLGYVALYQADTYSDIHIETRKVVESDAISRVEEYDSKDTEAVANQMMNQFAKEEKKRLEQEAEMESLFVESEDSAQMSLGDLDREVVEENEFALTDESEIASDEEILAAEAELDRGGDINV